MKNTEVERLKEKLVESNRLGKVKAPQAPETLLG